MNIDKYEEIINGEDTFKQIANYLINESLPILIGWTDEGYDHRGILFTYRPVVRGNLQRGLRWCYLYVSIIDHTSYRFLVKNKTDNRKDNGYLMEKLRLHENNCDKKICELINGVIHEIDKIECNIK